MGDSLGPKSETTVRGQRLLVLTIVSESQKVRRRRRRELPPTDGGGMTAVLLALRAGCYDVATVTIPCRAGWKVLHKSVAAVEKHGDYRPS
jgi:hypothetical protein